MSINWLSIVTINNDRYDRWVFSGPSPDWPRWLDSHSINYSINSGEPLRLYRSIRSTVSWSTQSTLTLKSGLRSYRYDTIGSTVSWSTQSTRQSTMKSPLRSYRSIRSKRSTVSWSTQSTLTLKSPLRSFRSIRSTVSWSTQLTPLTLALKTAYDKSIHLPLIKLINLTVSVKRKSWLCRSTDCRSLQSITIDTIDGCSPDQVLIDQDDEPFAKHNELFNQLWRAPSIVSIDTIHSQLIDTINSYSQERPSIVSIRYDTIRSTGSWSTQSTPLTLALKTAYDKSIHLPYQMNVLAFRKMRRYDVALFCKGQRHQNVHTCKVYLTL